MRINRGDPLQKKKKRLLFPKMTDCRRGEWVQISRQLCFIHRTGSLLQLASRAFYHVCRYHVFSGSMSSLLLCAWKCCVIECDKMIYRNRAVQAVRLRIRTFAAVYIYSLLSTVFGEDSFALPPSFALGSNLEGVRLNSTARSYRSNNQSTKCRM
jgi:hypothetical protein